MPSSGNVIATSTSRMSIIRMIITGAPKSATRKSIVHSSGSLPSAAANSATVLFWAHVRSGRVTLATMIRSQPPDATTRFCQPGSPFAMSWRIRWRSSAEPRRATNCSTPPSCAQGGINWLSMVLPASYG